MTDGAESPAQLQERIAFGLQGLGRRNAAHDFEQLCLGLARRRITSNLMPATGPVGAGGDQGRDGESYWSNLQNELPGTSLYASMVSGDKVVMGCTTQQDKTEGKIRSDLAKIAKDDTVTRVLYFLTVPVPVGQRHRLQQKALDAHEIRLEVWDLAAISQELAEHDLYHLAVQYLRLPSSLQPPDPPVSPALPDWYKQDRTKWRERTTPAATIGDLVDLRAPLRHSTFDHDARTDLPEWIDRLNPLLASSDVSLRARARYEILVASLRGLGTWDGRDEMVRLHFVELDQCLDDLGVLADTTLLLEYALGASVSQLSDVSLDEIYRWTAALRAEIQRQLADSPYADEELRLLTISARLALQVRYPEEWDPEEGPISTDETVQELEDALDRGELPSIVWKHLAFADLDAGMGDLVRLLNLAGRSRLAPVRDAADHFDMLVSGLRDHPSYRNVRDGFDEWIGRVEGESARGERAQARALNLFNDGRLLEALQEVHEAKVNWWNGDTVEGAVIMCMLASRIYSELGLPLAAKQYALTGAGAARVSGDTVLVDQIARGLLLASAYEWEAGAWLTAVRTACLGLMAQHLYSDDPLNEERYPYVSRALVNLAHTHRNAPSVGADTVTLIDKQFDALPGLNEVVAGIVQSAAETPPTTIDDLVKSTDRDALGRPFSDIGPRRLYVWKALGTVWEVRCNNDRADVLAAERFAAGLQIAQAELAGRDAALMNGRTRIEILTDGSGREDGQGVVDEPASAGAPWRLHLTPDANETTAAYNIELFTAILSVLAERTMLDQDDFMVVVNGAFESGLWHKLMSGRPYDEHASLVEPEYYSALAALSDDAFENVTHPDPQCRTPVLELPTSDAPSYNRQDNLDLIRGRYENLLPTIRYTLSRLRSDPSFQHTIAALRADGWLDWHLISAVANAALAPRLERRGIRPTQGAPIDRRAVLEVALQPEEEDDESIPASVLTEDHLRFALDLSLIAGLRNMGLTVHTSTPDRGAVREFLGRRYHLWTDDVDHPAAVELLPHPGP